MIKISPKLRRGVWSLTKLALLIFVLAIIWARFLPISTTPFMWGERMRLGEVRYDWISTDELPDYISTSVMAGEDAGFCEHNGVEWAILWTLFKEGGQRGGSTISQQMVKNLWLWHGDSRISRAMRKVIEIPITLLLELLYPKERIMELYLNIVEFDEGVFGIEAAAQHHFGKPASNLTREEMARLAAVLPNPARYQAVPPDGYVQRRAPAIGRGARDIEALGLNECLAKRD